MSIHELDAASNNSVDDIRELCRQVQIPPQVGRYKVFIIDEVHMLSASAFNAFLKTLEEPPSYVIFILATTEKHKILPTILSRCQVYDFARMTLQGTVDHLKYISQKEGITAEDEALHLIAQKADGGMRDALSIYDQMVSCCGNNLTLEAVSDALGVLSTDSYFEMVDHFINKEVQPCLVLLNNIINEGYEGGNFMNGLASHLRNLLVARDASTLPLLDTSEALRARYQEQAARCDVRMLYRALRLCNDCDNQYRTSRNKRLSLEITLIECAQIDPDAPAGGLRPTKLAPFFTQPVAAARKQTSAAAMPQEQNKTPHTVAAAPAQPAPAPRVRLSSLGPSLRISTAPQTAAPAVQTTEMLEQPNSAPATAALDDQELLRAWREFANMLQQEDKAMSMRMLRMTPEVTGQASFSVIVSNEQVKTYLLQLSSRLMRYLRRSLLLPNLRMDINVTPYETVQQSLSKKDIFQYYMSQNSTLQSLVDEFKLIVE